MVGLKATGVVVIYIYMYIHIYIYTYIYIHICSFMCATACGKRTYFMLSGWFSSSSGLFHTRLFWLYVCVSYAWVSWRGRVRIYILVEFTCVCVYITSRYTRSWIDVVRGVHMCLGIFIYIYAGFACIYLRICVQSSHVWVYVYIYVPKVYMCLCIY